MTDRKDLFGEGDFEELLQSSMPEAPSADIVKTVTPWRSALNKVLSGFALCCFTVNLFGLNYVLPLIGSVLSLLGFRTLRSENRWFFAGYALSAFRSVGMVLYFIFLATVYHSKLPDTVYIMFALSFAATFFQLLFFLLALISVKKKSTVPVSVKSGGAIIIWYILLGICAMLPELGSVSAIILLVAYIFILRSLFKTAKAFDESGYGITPKRVRLSQRSVWLIFTAVLAVGLFCAQVFFGSYKMNWTNQSVISEAQTEEIKNTLITMGFPQPVLDDLTEEDILACKDAIKLTVQEEDYCLYDTDNEDSISSSQKELHATAIALRLSQSRWKIIHHLSFADTADFCGTQCIELLSADINSSLNRDPNYRWRAVGEVSGQILCTKEGKRLVSPFYSLARERYGTAAISMLSTSHSEAEGIFAEFSMPSRAENRSAYISYTVEGNLDNTLLNSWLNYLHQTTILQYPVLSAKEYAKQGSEQLFNWTFHKVQSPQLLF